MSPSAQYPLCSLTNSPPLLPGQVGAGGGILGGDVCQGGPRDQAGGREGSRGAAYAGTEHSAVAQCL